MSLKSLRGQWVKSLCIRNACILFCSLWWTRADSRFSTSQWETALLCNDVSHWPGRKPRINPDEHRSETSFEFHVMSWRLLTEPLSILFLILQWELILHWPVTQWKGIFYWSLFSHQSAPSLKYNILHFIQISSTVFIPIWTYISQSCDIIKRVKDSAKIEIDRNKEFNRRKPYQKNDSIKTQELEILCDEMVLIDHFNHWRSSAVAVHLTTLGNCMHEHWCHNGTHWCLKCIPPPPPPPTPIMIILI